MPYARWLYPSGIGNEALKLVQATTSYSRDSNYRTQVSECENASKCKNVSKCENAGKYKNGSECKNASKSDIAYEWYYTMAETNIVTLGFK